MKTFLKVALIVALVAVIAHAWPLAAVPAGAAVATGLTLGSILLTGVLLAAGAGLGVLAVLATVVIGLAAILSPIWLPVLALVALIDLVRRTSRRTA